MSSARTGKKNLILFYSHLSHVYYHLLPTLYINTFELHTHSPLCFSLLINYQRFRTLYSSCHSPTYSFHAAHYSSLLLLTHYFNSQFNYSFSVTLNNFLHLCTYLFSCLTFSNNFLVIRCPFFPSSQHMQLSYTSCSPLHSYTYHTRSFMLVTSP